jgi:FkbH-like protein
MSQKLQFIEKASARGANVSALCREFGISRQTGHKWIRRYREQGYVGAEGLVPLHPLESPRRSAPQALPPVFWGRPPVASFDDEWEAGMRMRVAEFFVRSPSMRAYQAVNRAVDRAQVTAEQVFAGFRSAPERAASRERFQIFDLLGAKRRQILESWLESQFDPECLRRFGIPARELPPRPALMRTFVGPLFELLRAWLRTREERYADVYLDERLRYAPHLASAEVRQEFFDEVLRRDEAAILTALPASARRSVEELVHALHAPLRAPAPDHPVRVLALGDCLMHEVRVALSSRSRAENIPLDFRGLYFSALYGRGLSADAPLALLREFNADLVALSFLSYKGVAPYHALMAEAGRLRASQIDTRVDAILRIMRDFLGLLREHTDAPFIVHNASGLPLTDVRRFSPVMPPLSPAHQRMLEILNGAVAELVANTPKTMLLDEAAAAQARGLRACSERVVPRFLAPEADFHTSRFGEYLSPSYLDVLRSYRELSKCKVLALDFDNTLWTGVMADGPVAHRFSLQRLLRRLREAGILLVALSKNDPKNIRWGEMALEPGDFVLQKVSWNLKAASLKQAAEQLDLGLDTFVLLDDNPVERELVQAQYPEVHGLDPNAPHAEAWLERVLSFPNTRETEEARQRTELYRQQVARKDAVRPELDYPAMMASLDLTVRFGPAQVRDLERIAELVQRTNQFNTTTIRYSRQQLAEFLRDGAQGVYAATLADKFGSVGLVAVVIVRRDGVDRVFDSFIMSCRAMGFALERLVLRRVLDAEGGPEVRFRGRYVPTERNSPCCQLYAEAGFAPASDGEWILAPEAARPDEPAWFRLV